jgi:hypothetical protein
MPAARRPRDVGGRVRKQAHRSRRNRQNKSCSRHFAFAVKISLRQFRIALWRILNAADKAKALCYLTVPAGRSTLVAYQAPSPVFGLADQLANHACQTCTAAFGLPLQPADLFGLKRNLSSNHGYILHHGTRGLQLGLDLPLQLDFNNPRLEWKRVLRPREPGKHDAPELRGSVLPIPAIRLIRGSFQTSKNRLGPKAVASLAPKH